MADTVCASLFAWPICAQRGGGVDGTRGNEGRGAGHANRGTGRGYCLSLFPRVPHSCIIRYTRPRCLRVIFTYFYRSIYSIGNKMKDQKMNRKRSLNLSSGKADRSVGPMRKVKDCQRLLQQAHCEVCDLQTLNLALIYCHTNLNFIHINSLCLSQVIFQDFLLKDQFLVPVFQGARGTQKVADAWFGLNYLWHFRKLPINYRGNKLIMII